MADQVLLPIVKVIKDGIFIFPGFLSFIRVKWCVQLVDSRYLELLIEGHRVFTIDKENII